MRAVNPRTPPRRPARARCDSRASQNAHPAQAGAAKPRIPAMPVWSAIAGLPVARIAPCVSVRRRWSVAARRSSGRRRSLAGFARGARTDDQAAVPRVEGRIGTAVKREADSRGSTNAHPARAGVAKPRIPWNGDGRVSRPPTRPRAALQVSTNAHPAQAGVAKPTDAAGHGWATEGRIRSGSPLPDIGVITQ